MKKILKPKTLFKGRTTNSRGLAEVVDKVAKAHQPQKTSIRPGDTVKIHVRIKEGEKERIQIFEGVVIKEKNHGTGRSFTVRKISHGVGVERVFLRNSPKVAKIERVQAGKVRRAKLYYLRDLEGRKARIERDLGLTDEGAPVPAPEASAEESKPTEPAQS